MLGFRGDLRGQPDQLRSWREATERQVRQKQPRDWPDMPPAIQPDSDVPPPMGLKRWRRALLYLVLASLSLLFAVSIELILLLNR
jgi:type VI protein secretion system component VasF